MPTRKGRLTSLLELVRLPNVFTAPSDVAMGMAVSGVALTSSHAALLLASACAYAGGMALNDACDAPLDAHERPERPIPSGRISRASAFGVAAVLSLFGVIHSPTARGTFFLPWKVGETTPFTFAAAYFALGLVVLAASLLPGARRAASEAKS